MQAILILSAAVAFSAADSTAAAYSDTQRPAVPNPAPDSCPTVISPPPVDIVQNYLTQDASSKKKNVVSNGRNARPQSNNTMVTEIPISTTQHLAVSCSVDDSKKGDKDDTSDPLIIQALEILRRLVEVLAWPIVAFIAIKALGPEIKEKFPSLKSVEAGPFKAEFDQRVAEVRKEAEEQFPPPQSEPPVAPDEAKLIRMAKTSPRAAIIDAWRQVELSASKVVEQRPAISTGPLTSDGRVVRSRNTMQLARDLASLGLLNANQISVFHELRNLRNQAAHAEAFEMDFESALDYIQTSLALKNAIENRG